MWSPAVRPFVYVALIFVVGTALSVRAGVGTEWVVAGIIWTVIGAFAGSASCSSTHNQIRDEAIRDYERYNSPQQPGAAWDEDPEDR